VYFQRYRQTETLLKENLQRIQSTSPTLLPDLENVLRCVKKLELLPEQTSAILQACKESFFILCGGPGTGKTYTAGHLIHIFWSSLSSEQKSKCKIVLAAPTGKAATNLQASLAKATAGLTDFPIIQAQTLHSLLGIRANNSRKQSTVLSADLILVDECSMIDLQLMASLLAAIKPGARVILLGDKNQLPPVGVGMPFAHMKAGIELTQCLRSDLKTIVEFSDTVQKGNTEQALSMLSKEHSAISRISIDAKDNMRFVQKALIDAVLPHFTNKRTLSSLVQFCMLSPVREGPFGVNTLNTLITQRLMHAIDKEEWFIAPIVIAKNDQRLELSNGEIGLLFKKMTHDVDDRHFQEGDYALFESRTSSQAERRIPALLLPNFEYGYCLSVHKSQGSEFDEVLLLMPEGAEHFGREVLYTGVTRARKKLVIWGSEDILRKTIGKTARRLSSLCPCPCPCPKK
jgi:exodeoxyribonuclease V alpha subunit